MRSINVNAKLETVVGASGGFETVARWDGIRPADGSFRELQRRTGETRTAPYKAVSAIAVGMAIAVSASGYAGDAAIARHNESTPIVASIASQDEKDANAPSAEGSRSVVQPPSATSVAGNITVTQQSRENGTIARDPDTTTKNRTTVENTVSAQTRSQQSQASSTVAVSNQSVAEQQATVSQDVTSQTPTSAAALAPTDSTATINEGTAVQTQPTAVSQTTDSTTTASLDAITPALPTVSLSTQIPIQVIDQSAFGTVMSQISNALPQLANGTVPAGLTYQNGLLSGVLNNGTTSTSWSFGVTDSNHPLSIQTDAYSFMGNFSLLGGTTGYSGGIMSFQYNQNLPGGIGSTQDYGATGQLSQTYSSFSVSGQVNLAGVNNNNAAQLVLALTSQDETQIQTYNVTYLQLQTGVAVGGVAVGTWAVISGALSSVGNTIINSGSSFWQWLQDIWPTIEPFIPPAVTDTLGTTSSAPITPTSAPTTVIAISGPTPVSQVAQSTAAQNGNQGSTASLTSTAVQTGTGTQANPWQPNSDGILTWNGTPGYYEITNQQANGGNPVGVYYISNQAFITAYNQGIAAETQAQSPTPSTSQPTGGSAIGGSSISSTGSQTATPSNPGSITIPVGTSDTPITLEGSSAPATTSASATQSSTTPSSQPTNNSGGGGGSSSKSSSEDSGSGQQSSSPGTTTDTTSSVANPNGTVTNITTNGSGKVVSQSITPAPSSSSSSGKK